jgi:hypothetical protein
MRNLILVAVLAAATAQARQVDQTAFSFSETSATVYNYTNSGLSVKAVFNLQSPGGYDDTGSFVQGTSCASKEVTLETQNSGTRMDLDIPAVDLECDQAPRKGTAISATMSVVAENANGLRRNLRTFYFGQDYKDSKVFSVYNMSNLADLKFAVESSDDSGREFFEIVQVSFDSNKVETNQGRIGQLNSPQGMTASKSLNTWSPEGTHSSLAEFSLVGVEGNLGANPQLTLSRDTVFQLTQAGGTQTTTKKVQLKEVGNLATWKITL